MVYAGPARNGLGQIYEIDELKLEIRIMQPAPGETRPFYGYRTIFTRQNTVGQGTGEYVYGNGARIPGAPTRAKRKELGHTHYQTP